MRYRRGERGRRAALVEMTPLIDMVFILLIFFIVATSFVRESGVTVNKPESSRAQVVGDGFVSQALDFEQVDMFSAAGGYDRAYLYDSVLDDLLEAYPSIPEPKTIAERKP